MIDFNFENIDPIELDFDRISDWISQIVSRETKSLGDLTYIFCDDEYILDVNRQYLDHDYYTDIITFDYSEGGVVSGDLFISLDTVRSNSELFSTPFLQELHRVIIHGVLHLCGYKDKSEEDERLMREKENEALRFINMV
ncbi:MAG: rRNA maturation RNase YbeY [Flavobacteriia bacterium 40-80]|nr:MAG: rRNA maturation RNase YbeY [Flavobacteriia bacterium 40-80]